MSKATDDVLAERRRQIEVEGWTPEHDDVEHEHGDLAAAGMGYAQSAVCQLRHGKLFDGIPLFWPWAAEWWKPKNARRDQVRSAALILAEIERIDRAAASSATMLPVCAGCDEPVACRAEGCRNK